MSGLLLAAKAALEFIQSIDGYENSVTAVNLRREIEAVEQSVQSDELACDDIYHDFLLQWEEVNFCDVCGTPIRR